MSPNTVYTLLQELFIRIGNEFPFVLKCAIAANLAVAIYFVVYECIRTNYVLFQIEEDAPEVNQRD